MATDRFRAVLVCMRGGIGMDKKVGRKKIVEVSFKRRNSRAQTQKTRLGESDLGLASTPLQ